MGSTVTTYCEKHYVEMVEAMKKTPKKGEFRVIKWKGTPVLIEVIQVFDNDLARYVKGKCVLTGEEVSHGLYSEEQRACIGPSLNEMEVLAWASK